MTDVHKFMGLNIAKLSFFNDQVAQAARGFGVSPQDAKIVQDLLESTFNIQCAAPAKLVPEAQPQFQGFCLDSSCVVPNPPNCPSAQQAPSPAAVKGSSPTMGGGSTPVSGYPTSSSGNNTEITTSTKISSSLSLTGDWKVLTGCMLFALLL